MKQLFFSLTLIGLLLCFSCNFNNKNHKPKQSIEVLANEEEKPLIALCQLWGFLKYHHPSVAEGKYNWDEELISRISKIQEAKNESEWKEILDNWIDSLPPIPEKSNKQLPDKEITLKPDYGELLNPEFFNPETIEKIKFIINNAIITKNHYINVNSQKGLTTITNESFNDKVLYPNLSYRLLALFRYWNIVNYFYPYRELCDEPWPEVLHTMLPEFVYAKDVEQYITACLKLVSKIDDTHGFFNSRNSVFYLKQGILKVPFETGFIEKKLVVTRFIGDDEIVKEKIKIGDVITSINGDPIDSIVNRLLPITPASNYAVKLREIAKGILSGNETTVSLTVLKNGNPVSIQVQRYDARRLEFYNPSNPQPNSKGYRILDNNIGYVLPSSCNEDDHEKGANLVFNDTKGVIIDMRCYPDYYISFSFLERLEHHSVKCEIMSSADISYPGYFFVTNSGDRPYEHNNKHKLYSNPIIVIVNEITQSKAEDNVLYLQLALNVKVIGSTTAAANGNVFSFHFPCGIETYMTGRMVQFKDGSNFQRKGVKIDEYIEPTIQGIQEGRDELLERAIEIIEESYN